MNLGQGYFPWIKKGYAGPDGYFSWGINSTKKANFPRRRGFKD